jgi:hypothetical protein
MRVRRLVRGLAVLAMGMLVWTVIPSVGSASNLTVAAASLSGYAAFASVSPPTVVSRNSRLPTALQNSSPEAPPLLLSPSTFVAAETTPSSQEPAVTTGLAAWNTQGRLLWDYRPANLKAMTPPVWNGRLLSVVITQERAAGGAHAAQTLVELTPAGNVVASYRLRTTTVQTLSWSAGAFVATVLVGNSCGLDRISASGTLQWHRAVAYCQSVVPFGSSLLLANADTVAPDGLEAVNGVTGRQMWRAIGPERTGWAVLAVADGVAVVQAPAPLPYGLDIEGISLQSGRILWRERADDIAEPESPPSEGPGVVANDQVWVDCPRRLEVGSLACSVRSLRTGGVVRTLRLAAPSLRATLAPIAVSDRYALIGVNGIARSGFWLVSITGSGEDTFMRGRIDGGWTYNSRPASVTVQPDGLVWQW